MKNKFKTELEEFNDYINRQRSDIVAPLFHKRIKEFVKNLIQIQKKSSEGNFRIYKTMCRNRKKWIYFIEDLERTDCNGQFAKIVGRIIWNGEEWVVDNK